MINGRLFATAGWGPGNISIQLVEIDPETLDILAVGDDDISAESPIWVQGDALYAIITSGGNLYLGRFDQELENVARSGVQVHPYAAVSFQGDLIFVQRANGQVVILNASDLSERR
jgi:hypothetical protein